MNRCYWAIAVVFFFVAISPAEEQRATLRGRFVFSGDIPEPQPLKVDKDQEVCAKKLLDERLLVDAKTRGIANVVVQLVVPRDERPPLHPRLDELRKAPRLLISKDCRFEPHVLSVIIRQQLIVDNRDPVGHNWKIDVIKNVPPGDSIPSSQRITRTFKAPETIPVTASCAIHPWMRAYVVILDHPYIAISDSDGKFEIPDLPRGEWTFRAWHEANGYVKEVTIDEKKVDWDKGRFRVELRDDEDLGTIAISADQFQR